MQYANGVQAHLGDISDPDTLSGFMNGVDAFFHCAAEINNIDKMFTTNVTGTQNIINEYASKFPFIKLLNNPKGFVPSALNIGIQNAQGEILIRIDGHCYVESDYVKQCVHFLEKTKAECVGGPMRPVSKTYIGNTIALAHYSIFGLGAAIFTNNSEKGEKIAATQLESGSCFVNTFVKSDPRLPFGGIKESGYGRELSHYGIKEFVNIKSVWVK